MCETLFEAVFGINDVILRSCVNLNSDIKVNKKPQHLNKIRTVVKNHPATHILENTEFNRKLLEILYSKFCLTSWVRRILIDMRIRKLIFL